MAFLDECLLETFLQTCEVLSFCLWVQCPKSHFSFFLPSGLLDALVISMGFKVFPTALSTHLQLRTVVIKLDDFHLNVCVPEGFGPNFWNFTCFQEARTSGPHRVSKKVAFKALVTMFDNKMHVGSWCFGVPVYAHMGQHVKFKKFFLDSVTSDLIQVDHPLEQNLMVIRLTTGRTRNS